MERKSIPVCLLTGYLGSGKTTLMNYILQQDHGYHVAVIVNDVGEVNIDARLIAEGASIQKEDSGSVVSLSNGCACCTLKADLIEQLKQLCDAGKYDYILIEASGAGNPITLAQTITMMDQALGMSEDEEPLCYLDNIVTVADAFRLTDEFNHGEDLNKATDDEDVERLIIEQLEFCNTILLNKVDLVSAEDLAQVKDVIKALAPDAKLIETSHSVVDLANILGTDAFDFETAAMSAGWVKALENDDLAKEEEEEEEHHHHHDDEDEEHEHCCHHHHDDEDEEHEHCCHHHHDDEDEEHEHCCHHHHDDEDEEHEHCCHHHHDDEEHEHGPNCTCGCHGHHHHHHVKYGIETFVYFRRRPFSQPKFAQVINKWRTKVIRSKGFLWFDDDRIRAYIFEQCGKQIQLEDDGLWVDAEDLEMRKQIIAANPELLEEWDEKYGDRMIRLVFIGKGLDKKALIAELDAALSE